MQIKDMLEYKYLLVLEGNRCITSFNVWSFLSNSVVLMTKPIRETILQHHKLIPNYHYVEIKPDMSDLLDKIMWCENNLLKCLQIIKNKKKFMIGIISRNLYKESATLLENNFVPYIDKIELTQIIFHKVLKGDYPVELPGEADETQDKLKLPIRVTPRGG